MVLFWEFNHFVVLEGIRGKRFYVNDPGYGPRRLTLAEFDESYTGICFGFQRASDFRKGGSRPSILTGLPARFGHARARSASPPWPRSRCSFRASRCRR